MSDIPRIRVFAGGIAVGVSFCLGGEMTILGKGKKKAICVREKEREIKRTIEREKKEPQNECLFAVISTTTGG